MAALIWLFFQLTWMEISSLAPKRKSKKKVLSLILLIMISGLSFLFFGCRASQPTYIIFCAGNSLTEKGYPPYLRRLLKQQGYRVKIYNFGRSGYNSREYLIYLKKNEAYLKSLRPDFILLELGTNDVRLDGDHTSLASFEKNMREIIHIFSSFESRQGKKPRILLALIPPIPENVSYPFGSEAARRVALEINPTLKGLAQEYNLPIIDHWIIFEKRPELLPDIHPNQEGYREMAKAWLAALRPYLVKTTK